METKLPIPRYPSYLVTTDGTVYSTKTDRKRQLVPQSDGSLKVGLYSKGMKMEYVHRLVAETFLSDKREEHHNIVRHKDGNKSNNNVDNLYWSSHAEIRSLLKMKFGSSPASIIFASQNKVASGSEPLMDFINALITS